MKRCHSDSDLHITNDVGNDDDYDRQSEMYFLQHWEECTKENTKEALRLVKKAADRGYTPAAVTLYWYIDYDILWKCECADESSYDDDSDADEDMYYCQCASIKEGYKRMARDRADYDLALESRSLEMEADIRENWVTLKRNALLSDDLNYCFMYGRYGTMDMRKSECERHGGKQLLISGHSRGNYLCTFLLHHYDMSYTDVALQNTAKYFRRLTRADPEFPVFSRNYKCTSRVWNQVVYENNRDAFYRFLAIHRFRRNECPWMSHVAKGLLPKIFDYVYASMRTNRKEWEWIEGKNGEKIQRRYKVEQKK